MLKSKTSKFMLIIFALILTGLAVFGVLYSKGLTDISPSPKYNGEEIKVACVGDSVTYGYGIKGWKKNNYPAVLSRLLGEKYHVANFGISGSTVQDTGDQPYTATEAYKSSLEYEADILIFMLGSNDSKPENWTDEEKFLAFYNSLLDSYLQKDKKPTVYLCTVATANYPEGITSGLTNYDVQPKYVEVAAELIRGVAEERGYPLIDINNLTENRRELFGKDNVHPNAEGAETIATAIYEAIK